MASFAHVAVGMLAGRLHSGTEARARPSPRDHAAIVAFALLAMLPDADVLLVTLGAPDSGAIGHRGASHSLFFAAALGLACGALARKLGARGLRTGILVAIAIASHGILDALGEGGRGIPLLWPFSDQRFMSPWRLLPDAPRGLKFLSWNGAVTLTLEFLFFLPLTLYALWPRKARPPSLTVVPGSGIDLSSPSTLSSPAPAPAEVPEQEAPLRSSG